MISTEMAELMALSDRVLVMQQGRVVAEFPRAEATQERILEAALGSPEVQAV
jgi:ABC-type sugar transport system ATPase subunit